MCWGVPAKILSLDGPTALVDFGGVKKEVVVAASGISSGDLVMIHAGMIIGKLSPEDFMENVALYRDIRTQELLDAGLDEKAAKEKATDETDKLLNSLGVRGSIASIEPEVAEPMAVAEKEIFIPSNAFKRSYKVSLSDTDYLQVMHYTNYFRFCERAQQELLEGLGFSYAALIHKFGLFVPTVETSGRILGPVRLDNMIEVAVWVEEVGRKHIKFRNVIKNLTSGKVVAECSTVSVCTDTTLMESMPLPAELAEKLKRYMVETD
ncbi:MAG: HypC/HybG/HupF family hydrogenase formation chaperone [Candidatus Hodarchaeaceae archaeon]|nr:HypC/HybG/HupF family hydrogenase formation chaperone [Candidatus Hodarchaeaceae archaeon]